jgi:plastocyanin
MDRRSYLRYLAVVAAGSLAGCGGQSEGTPTSTPRGVDTQTSPTATATASPTPSPTPADEATPTGTPTPADETTPTGTPTPTGPPVAAEVAVGPGGDFVFDPETVTVAVGDTVRWVWESNGHNVKADDVPADSDWSGTPGGGLDTFATGHVYTHEFQVAGEFDYLCQPHRSYGMRGTVVVQ